MWILFNILIVLTAVFILPIPGLGDIFWIPKEMLFNLLGFSFIASTFLTNNERVVSFKNKWLGAILIYTAVSFAWFFYIPLVFNNADKKILWNLWNFRPTINLILALLLIKSLVEYTDFLHRWVTIAKTLCWLGFIFSVYALLQYSGIEQFYGNHCLVHPQWQNFRMVTFLGNHFLTANFIAMISPLCLMFKDLRYKIFYLVSLITIIVANSAISIVAFIAGLFIYLIFSKKFKLVTLLTLVCILVFYFIHKTRFFDFSGRLQVWSNVLGDFKNYYTGYGLGSLAQNFGVKRFISAHCEPLHILYEGGILFSILVIGYLVNLFKRILIKEDTMLSIGYCSALVAYLVICMAGFPLRIAPLALVGITYISALEAQL